MSNVSAASSTSPRPLRIMLVDDHQTVRQGLRVLLQSLPNTNIVHEESDGESAIAAVRQIEPDLLVVDLSMPRVNGLALLRLLRYARLQPKVVVLSRFRETGYVRAAFAEGARAYVFKQSPFEELRRAIDAVVRGERYVDSSLDASQVDSGGDDGGVPALTTREIEVLRRYAVGHSNRDIGEALEIRVKTVEAHKAHAMKKLGLMNRRDLIQYAAVRGWFNEL